MRNILNKIEDLISSILLILTSLLVFIQVIFRYFFNYSISWSEEIALLMIAWFIFIGCSVAAREGAHVSMEVLENIVSEKIKKILSILILLISIGFTIIMIYSGFRMVGNAIELKSMATSISLPLWVAYLSVPVGMFLMFIEYIFELIDIIKGLFSSHKEEV